MRRFAVSCLALASVVLTAVPAARAWGPLGHGIVCEIAYQELEPEARAEVERLIRIDPEFSTFADACNWPDSPKRRRIQHWVNFSRQTERIRRAECPLDDKCLFSGIRRSRRVLARASSPDSRRLEELKFLGHWIGNIHQPFHVAFEDDRGGNEVSTDGECSGNLHWVWDSCIAERRLRPIGDLRRIAETLRQRYSSDLAGWRCVDEVKWADESFQLVTDPTVEYCHRRSRGCWYSADHERYRAASDLRIVTVDEAYLDLHTEAVERRLTQAGIRLAVELNRLLIPAP